MDTYTCNNQYRRRFWILRIMASSSGVGLPLGHSLPLLTFISFAERPCTTIAVPTIVNLFKSIFSETLKEIHKYPPLAQCLVLTLSIEHPSACTKQTLSRCEVLFGSQNIYRSNTLHQLNAIRRFLQLPASEMSIDNQHSTKQARTLPPRYIYPANAGRKKAVRYPSRTP